VTHNHALSINQHIQPFPSPVPLQAILDGPSHPAPNLHITRIQLFLSARANRLTQTVILTLVPPKNSVMACFKQATHFF
jgi:hypothetical protein